MKKKFKENSNTYVFTSKYVVLNGSPILYVSHDIDGDWQFLGSENNLKEEDAMIIALSELIDIDPTILEIADLPFGKEAIRESNNSEWQIILI